MKRKVILGASIMLMLVIFLAGCTKSVKGESEIKKDLSGKDIPIQSDFLNGTRLRHPDEIKSFKIAKRQTNKNDKKDIVYADVTFKDKNADISGELELDYNYYDEGGWILDNIAPAGSFKITPTERVTDDQIKKDIVSIWGSTNAKEQWDIKVIKDEFKDAEKTTQDILNLEVSRTYPNSVTTSQFEVTYELSTGYNNQDKDKPYQWSYIGRKVILEGKPKVTVPFDISNEQFKKDIVGVAVHKSLGDEYTNYLKETDIKSVEVDKSSFYTDETGTHESFEAKLEFADEFIPVSNLCREKKVSIDLVQYRFENGQWKRDPGIFSDVLYVK